MAGGWLVPLGEMHNGVRVVTEELRLHQIHARPLIGGREWTSRTELVKLAGARGQRKVHWRLHAEGCAAILRNPVPAAEVTSKFCLRTDGQVGN